MSTIKAGTIKLIVDDVKIFKNTLAADHKQSYEDLVAAERELESLRHSLLRNALDGKLPGEDSSYSSLFHRTGDCDFAWKCSTSPIGTCVYDSYKDRAWDNCLFCGDPYERK